MIITIARECGCYGDEIGQLLADRLGILLYNKKKLTGLAQEKGIYEHYPDYFGENSAGTLLSAIAADDGEDSVVRRTPRKVLDALLGEENAFVLIGRAGNYAYRNEENVVRVFLSGDKEARIAHLMEKHQISRHEAKKLMEKTEQRRREYHTYYTGEDWGYAANYDLCINDTRFGIEGTAEMILQYVRNCEAQKK